MKHILFVCYGGGHAAMLVPVLKEIQKKKNYQLSVLALTTACSVMEAENIEYVTYKDFSRLAAPNFTDIGKSLVGSKSDSSIVPYDESAAYYGINYLDLVEQHGDEIAEQMYFNSGRQCFYPINFVTRLLDELNVDLLIATNSPRTERAAFDAAGELGIKSLCLVDLFALQEVKWIGVQGYASKICVLNQSVKDMFINAGRQCDEIEVTGNPAFDSLVAPAVIINGQMIKAERGWVDDKIITLLYASQPEPETHPFNGLPGDPMLPRNIERLLREFVKCHKNYRLVVRYHPSENIEFQPQENVFFSPREENLHGLLHAVDIVIVTASTVGLEGHLIGKKIISIDNSIFTDDAPYSKMGISSGISKPEMLTEKIISISYNLAVQCKGIERLNATSKVISVIEQL